MRRIWSWLTLVLGCGIFGGTGPANAAAFLAINGGNWTYSAALAQSPVGTAYYWGFSVGVGSVSYAYAYSFSGGGNNAAAYAIARAGFGWRGAWYAGGLADPQADLGIDIPDISGSSLATLVNGQDSATLGTEVAADATSASSLSSAGYTIDYDLNGDINGLTFNPGDNDSSSETNALDALALIVVDSSAENDFCTAIGDGGCSTESAQTNKSGDVTSLGGVISDLGVDALDTEVDMDPTNLSSGGTFSFGDLPGTSSNSKVILVEEGTVPEPASILLLGQGLLGLIAFRRRRRPA